MAPTQIEVRPRTPTLPDDLCSAAVVELSRIIHPKPLDAIIVPDAGKGTVLRACMESFAGTRRYLALDPDPSAGFRLRGPDLDFVAAQWGDDTAHAAVDATAHDANSMLVLGRATESDFANHFRVAQERLDLGPHRENVYLGLFLPAAMLLDPQYERQMRSLSRFWRLSRRPTAEKVAVELESLGLFLWESGIRFLTGSYLGGWLSWGSHREPSHWAERSRECSHEDQNTVGEARSGRRQGDSVDVD